MLKVPTGGKIDIILKGTKNLSQHLSSQQQKQPNWKSEHREVISYKY